MSYLDSFNVVELGLDDGAVSKVTSDGGLTDRARLELDAIFMFIRRCVHPLVKRADFHHVFTVLKLHESDVNSS